MTYLVNELKINWRCKHTWVRSSKNTGWCLLGCAIGDIGTILYFQLMGIDWPVWLIMTLAGMWSGRGYTYMDVPPCRDRREELFTFVWLFLFAAIYIWGS